MNENFVKISTNWELIHGKIKETLVTKILDSDAEETLQNDESDLDDIVSLERSVHLNKISTNGNENNDEINDNELNKCEINLEIFPKFLATKITLITDCPKMEIFLNIQDEYLKTEYGELLDDFDGIKVYRYDIIFDKNLSCVKTVLKLISNSTDLWMYGIQIELQQNPNFLRSFAGHSNINLENVQNMLTNCNQKISPGAERCKTFLQNYMKIKSPIEKKFHIPNQDYSEFFNNSTIQTLLQDKNSFKLPTNLPTDFLTLQNLNLGNESTNYNKEFLNNNDLIILKEFLAEKVLESEGRIVKRLEQIEQRQDEKLNKILRLLEK